MGFQYMLHFWSILKGEAVNFLRKQVQLWGLYATLTCISFLTFMKIVLHFTTQFVEANCECNIWFLRYVFFHKKWVWRRSSSLASINSSIPERLYWQLSGSLDSLSRGPWKNKSDIRVSKTRIIHSLYCSWIWRHYVEYWSFHQL